LNIDSIQNGIVLDHIQAGKAMRIYDALGLDELDCSVAIIKNVKSRKMGRKDIIKIDDTFSPNLDVIGYIDQDITVNIIKEGKLVEKRKLFLPKKLINIVKCNNPRCITTIEQEAEQVFVLSHSGGRAVYRCVYCDTAAKSD
jgi:aspartate carbamoyltransferase regulatory subunit